MLHSGLMGSLTARMTKACTIPEFVPSSQMLVAGIDTGDGYDVADSRSHDA